MNENLIVEDNTIYEIDRNVLRKKESVREKRAKKWKQKTLKSKKCKGEIDKIVIQVKNMNKMSVKFVFYRLYDKF